MNIFYLDKNPYKAAANMYNKHVVKMILESAQLLCSAHHHYTEKYNSNNSYIPYKKTHTNHPCAVWVRQNTEHYYWLWQHLCALGNEYEKRYGKIHKTIASHKYVLQNYPIGIPTTLWQDPPQCMPDEYKVDNDVVSAYWNYYENEKYKVANKNEVKRIRS